MNNLEQGGALLEMQKVSFFPDIEVIFFVPRENYWCASSGNFVPDLLDQLTVWSKFRSSKVVKKKINGQEKENFTDFITINSETY